MALGKCVNNHPYNRDKFGDKCPFCGAAAKEDKEEGKTRAEIEAMYRLPEKQYTCGWLLCTEGIERDLIQ